MPSVRKGKSGAMASQSLTVSQREFDDFEKSYSNGKGKISKAEKKEKEKIEKMRKSLVNFNPDLLIKSSNLDHNNGKKLAKRSKNQRVSGKKLKMSDSSIGKDNMVDSVEVSDKDDMTVDILSNSSDQSEMDILTQSDNVSCGNEYNVDVRESNNVAASDKNNMENTKETPFYPNEYDGDVFVLIDTSKLEDNGIKKMKNGLFLWEKIRNIRIPGIKMIKAIGVTLYKVLFDSVENANKCLLNDDLKLRNMRAFVPYSFLETYGVIRDIPVFLSEEDIMHNIQSPFKVKSVKRFRRRITNEKNEEIFEPTYSVKIGFAGNDLPNEVILNYTILKVDQYYPPVRQCRNCGRIGHTQNGCRSAKRCLMCGKAGGCNPSCGIIKCILCNGSDHQSHEKNKCSKWMEEQDVKKIMTIKKISRREVYETYRQNRFSILDNYEDDFPVLSKPENIKNKDEEVNNVIIKKRYNKVVRQPNRGRQLQHASDSNNHNRRSRNENQSGNPVFNMPNYHRVSEIEKTVYELTKLCKDIFIKLDNQHAITAVDHLSKRLDNQFKMLSAVSDLDNSGDNPTYSRNLRHYEDLSIQLSIPEE